MTFRLAELPAPDVARRLSRGAVAILPMGSLETHGPALPMGDFLLAEMIALRIAEAAAAVAVEALTLPVIPFGGEDFFHAVPGAIALSPALLTAVVEEIGQALIRNGAPHLLIVNGHGGSIASIEAATRRLQRRHGVVIPVLHLWREAARLHSELGGCAESLGHGGDPLLSVALYLRPDLCRCEALRGAAAARPLLGFPPSGFGTVRIEGIDFAIPMTIEDIAPGGVAAANPAWAHAAHGAALVERLVIAGVAACRALTEPP